MSIAVIQNYIKVIHLAVIHLIEIISCLFFKYLRFVNATDKHEMSYSWNPCFNFTEGPCKEVAVGTFSNISIF